MKIQNQVCTVEQAKKLKELGIDQGSSHFRYSYSKLEMGKEKSWELVSGDLGFAEITNKDITVSTFTVAELGDILPDLIETDRQYELVTVKESTDAWVCMYVRENSLLKHLYTTAEQYEACAKAKMLILLLEKR